MPFEYLEHITSADVAFKAWGRSLEESFSACADALVNAMVEQLDSIRPLEKREINLKNEQLDLLLFDFLQEIIYYKDSELLLLRVPMVNVAEEKGGYRLRAEAMGEKLDPARHDARVDVKAVTLHRFSLQKSDRGWEAMVVLDV
jgi:SHS2 domain-containing protein